MTTLGGATLSQTSPDPLSFREAMSRFATGVTVATARIDGTDAAVTVNAFASVSLDPVLVLVSVSSRGRWAQGAVRSGAFAVSILNDRQRDLAAACARPGRSDDTALLERAGISRCFRTGCALVDGALAALVCTVDQSVAAGDHTIIIGRVEEIFLGADTTPLLFVRRRFAAATPVGDSVTPGSPPVSTGLHSRL